MLLALTSKNSDSLVGEAEAAIDRHSRLPPLPPELDLRELRRVHFRCHSERCAESDAPSDRWQRSGPAPCLIPGLTGSSAKRRVLPSDQRTTYTLSPSATNGHSFPPLFSKYRLGLFFASNDCPLAVGGQKLMRPTSIRIHPAAHGARNPCAP